MKLGLIKLKFNDQVSLKVLHIVVLNFILRIYIKNRDIDP